MAGTSSDRDDRRAKHGVDPMSTLGVWMRDLRRRRVPQVTLAYVAFMFVVLQGGQVLFETLDAPKWAMRLLLGLLMLGLPIAVLLSWFYDLTPSGLRRDSGSAAGTDAETQLDLLPADEASDEDGSSTRVWWLAGVLALVVVGAIGTWAWFNRTPGVGIPVEASIAVLPFTNLGGTLDDGYFAEGLAVEMQDALAGVPGLKVAARTSELSKSLRDLDIKQLGATLGVATLLDAAVRRDGNHLRISARLSDTRTGFTLWTHTYDRERSDVFAMQSEIAGEVVHALLGVLPQDHKLVRRLTPTTNLEAYDDYLRGQQLLRQPATEARLDKAIDYFGSAVSSDIGFARAQAGICRAEIKHFDDMRDAKAFALAQSACARATAMDPQLREVSLALGDLYRTHGEADKAQDNYTRALGDPALRPAAYIGLARLQGDLGHGDLALAYFERARVLRPGDADIYKKLGYYHFLSGDLGPAIDSYRTASTLAPDDASVWSSLGGLYLSRGDSDQAIDAFNRALAIKPTYDVLANLGTLKFGLGAYEQAADYYRRAAALEPADYRNWGNVGDALAAVPATASQAHAAYGRAAQMVARYVAAKPNDAQALACLAWYRINLGDEKGAREAIAAAETLTTEQADVALLDAQTFALLGKPELARARVLKATRMGIPPARIASNPWLKTFAPSTQPTTEKVAASAADQ